MKREFSIVQNNNQGKLPILIEFGEVQKQLIQNEVLIKSLLTKSPRNKNEQGEDLTKDPRIENKEENIYFSGGENDLNVDHINKKRFSKEEIEEIAKMSRKITNQLLMEENPGEQDVPSKSKGLRNKTKDQSKENPPKKNKKIIKKKNSKLTSLKKFYFAIFVIL